MIFGFPDVVFARALQTFKYSAAMMKYWLERLPEGCCRFLLDTGVMPILVQMIDSASYDATYTVFKNGKEICQNSRDG